MLEDTKTEADVYRTMEDLQGNFIPFFQSAVAGDPGDVGDSFEGSLNFLKNTGQL